MSAVSQPLSSDTYTVEQADLSRDRELIIDLWSRNLLAHTPEEHRARFDWHYGENASRCFLVRHSSSGKVVGTAGLGIRRTFVDKRELVAGIAIDFTVEPEHRTLQPAVFLARAVAQTLESGVDFIFALPNKNAKAVFRRVGYVEVGPFRRFVKVLDTGEYLRRRSLPAAVRAPLAAVLNTGQRVLLRLRRGFARAYRAVELDWRDPKLESLWTSAVPSDGMMGDRRADYLEWRFGRCPLHDHHLLGFFADGAERLLGYAVVYNGPASQLKIPDLLLAPDASHANALMAISHWAGQKGLSSVAYEIVHPENSLLLALRQTGFVDRGTADVLFVLEKRGESLAKTKSWYFLRGDEFYNTF
jgi:hypothetical protein